MMRIWNRSTQDRRAGRLSRNLRQLLGELMEGSKLLRQKAANLKAILRDRQATKGNHHVLRMAAEYRPQPLKPAVVKKHQHFM